ncbi:UNVERIFIED_CONTAM: Neurogenic locus Notch protein [Trichonephila clavipes]
MFVGEYCQHLNPCHTGPGPRCQNGGTCNVEMSVTSGPTFSCSCPVGYSASLCEIAVQNSCNSNPCLNGGTCTLVTLTNYTCSCAVGYRGKNGTVLFIKLSRLKVEGLLIIFTMFSFILFSDEMWDNT